MNFRLLYLMIIFSTESNAVTDDDDAQSINLSIFSAYADNMQNLSLLTRSQTLGNQPSADTDTQSATSGIFLAHASIMSLSSLPAWFQASSC